MRMKLITIENNLKLALSFSPTIKIVFGSYLTHRVLCAEEPKGRGKKRYFFPKDAYKMLLIHSILLIVEVGKRTKQANEQKKTTKTRK